MQTRLLCILLAGILLATSASGQVCGDANANGYVSIGDLSYLTAYLLGGQVASNAQMDMDDWSGVALGDAVHMISYFFFGGYLPDCEPSHTYSFAPSPNDTVFIPRMTSVPDGIDSVKLPVRASLQPGTRGVMCFLRETGLQSGFARTAHVVPSPNWTFGNLVYRNGDYTKPAFFVAADYYSNALAGDHELFSLVYERVAPGSTGGQIDLESYDIDALVRLSVERNGDLFVPTVVYYDYIVPPDTLAVSVSSLAFTTAAGRPSKDTMEVTFASSGGPVTFDLVPSASWISLDASTALTTPAVVRITANGFNLEQGDYNGEVTIANATSVAGVDTPHPTIAVSVAVSLPNTYPPGDLNCSGVVDLSDLALLITYLISAQKPILVPCY